MFVGTPIKLKPNNLYHIMLLITTTHLPAPGASGDTLARLTSLMCSETQFIEFTELFCISLVLVAQNLSSGSVMRNCGLHAQHHC